MNNKSEKLGLDANGNPKRRKTKPNLLIALGKSKKGLIGIAASIAAVALLLGNIETIIEISSNLFSKATEEKFEHPILIGFSVNNSKYGSERNAILEDGSNLVDITLSYEGEGVLLFEALIVRHFAGPCMSMPTGKLVSSAKYKFQFDYGGYHEFNLNPPLVLDPKDASLLNFQIELAPNGTFPSTCGAVFAKLAYQNGSGVSGTLPLADISMASEGSLEFPVFHAQTGAFGEIVKSEIYTLSKSGAIKGKPID